MTLIEVVAGLALLAAVLILVFAAKSHVARQQVRADRRLRAVAAADALLAAWWQDPAKFPRAAAGAVPGQADLAWQTRIVPNPPAEALGGQAVRLDIYPVAGGATAEDRGGPRVSVEIVLPVPKPATPPAVEALRRR